MKDKNIKIIMIMAIVIIMGILLYFLVFDEKDKDIVLNKQYLSIYPGQTETIIGTITPESNQEIIWTSTNQEIATVDRNGFVEAKNPGYVKIIASIENGKISNSCVVAVLEKEIESIDLQEAEINIKEGQTWELKPIIIPEALSSEKITWTSSDENVATVSELGMIEGKTSGIVTITGDVLGKEVTCLLFVGDKASSIRINKNETKLNLNGEEELSIIKEPEKSIDEKITWTSSDNDTVEVDENGKITAKKVGNAIITAETEHTKLKSTCKVTVEAKKYQVKYMEINRTVTKMEGEKLGTLPTPTKKNYKLLGWYTKEKDGTKVTKDTIVKENMKLYPHWETTYVITNDSSRIKGFGLKASYDSSTLKYKILTKGSNYYTVVWVNNANKQLNSAIMRKGKEFVTAQGGALLNNEINQYGYKNKSLVAVNGSFKWNSASDMPIIMNKGVAYVNSKSKHGYNVIGVNRYGELKNYPRASGASVYAADGVRNTFAGNYYNTSGFTGGGSDNSFRTEVCQIDEKNFALFTGTNITIQNAQKQLHDYFGCRVVVNLDGGGSVRLYYKKGSSGVTTLFKAWTDPDRELSDVLYFVE